MTTTSSTSRRSSSNAVGTVDSLQVRCSVRFDGDFHLQHVPLAELDQRRRALVDLPWTMLDEEHGVGVRHVRTPGEFDGASGDIAITEIDDAVLGCWVGDCAPVVLVGARRQFGVVHAGWRGLAAGVIDVAIGAFREPVVRALVGPSIHACCYEFGGDELVDVAAGVHAVASDVEATTRSGTRALDMIAAIRAACDWHQVPLEVLAGCTGCDYDGFSHRMRRDPQRHVVAVWRSNH